MFATLNAKTARQNTSKIFYFTFVDNLCLILYTQSYKHKDDRMNKTLKTTVIAGVAALLGSATLIAQDAAPASQNAWYVPSIEKFSADFSFGIETMHVFRGKAVTKDNIQASIDVGYAVTDALGVYAGVWNNSSLSNGNRDWNETDLSFGATYAFKGFVFDAGYTYYWFNNSNAPVNTNEIKAGVSYDTSAFLGKYLGGATLTPSLYYYYGFEDKANFVELALNASLPVSKWAFDKDYLDIEASIFYGYANARRSANNHSRDENSYNYVGLSADLVWTVNDMFKVRGGLRWTSNDDGSSRNDYSADQVWWGISASMGF